MKTGERVQGRGTRDSDGEEQGKRGGQGAEIMKETKRQEGQGSIDWLIAFMEEGGGISRLKGLRRVAVVVNGMPEMVA